MFDAPFLRYALLPCVAVFYVWFLAAMLRDRKRVIALARHTFVESLRQKILLVPLLFMAVVMSTSLYSEVFREPARVKIVTSSCLWSLTVFGMVAAILLGARGIPEELTSKTIYTVITKPVSRSTYLAGKVFGFSAVCFVILAIMGTGSLLLIRWVGRDAVLEARRTLSGGRLSVEGGGVETRDGRSWIAHEPGSALKWRFEGMPELSREEKAIVTLKFKSTPADPSAPMPVAVEFKNADDRSIQYGIDDARESKEIVTDLPGSFLVKGTLDVLAVPLNGQDRLADDRDSVGVTAAGKKYEAQDMVYRRANSWGVWRFSQVPHFELDENIMVRICLKVRAREGEKAIAARVRVNPKGTLGPSMDVKIENAKPIEIETPASAFAGKLEADATRTLDVAILPLEVGDSYEIGEDAVTLVAGGGELRANRALPEGYGLTPTTHTYWISPPLKRKAIWRFRDLPLRSLAEDTIIAEGRFRIGEARKIDINLSVVNPSSPELRSEIPIHAVRKDAYQVDAKPVEFSLDRRLVGSDGRLEMVIERKDPSSVLGLPLEDCVLLYARPGSFEINFFAALAVIFFQLVLITAISVASSTCLSWPVSILVSFFVFFCGYIIDIMRNAADILNPYGHHVHGLVAEPSSLTKTLNKIIEVVLGFLGYILPDFRKFEVSQDVIGNRAIGGISISGAILYCAAYVAVAFLIAHVLFRRREIE